MKNIILILTLAIITACSLKSGPDKSTRLGTQKALNACLAYCQSGRNYLPNTKKGCLEGCYAALENYPYNDKVFSTWEICRDKMNDPKDNYVLKSVNDCADASSSAEVKRGCYDAARSFYLAIRSAGTCTPLDSAYVPNTNVVEPPKKDSKMNLGENLSH